MSEEELIETLKAFEKNRVEQLEEPAKNLFYAIMKIADERDRLNNIINELEKWLEEDLKQVYRDAGHRHNLIFEVLEKLQELKGENNE